MDAFGGREPQSKRKLVGGASAGSTHIHSFQERNRSNTRPEERMILNAITSKTPKINTHGWASGCSPRRWTRGYHAFRTNSLKICIVESVLYGRTHGRERGGALFAGKLFGRDCWCW